MLPLLLFEVAWKAMWLLTVAWPLQAAGKLDAQSQETVWECLLAVVFLAVIPWDYVANVVVRRSTPRPAGHATRRPDDPSTLGLALRSRSPHLVRHMSSCGSRA